MKYRYFSLLLLIILPLSSLTIPRAHANYRINTTVSDTWAGSGSSSAIVNAVKLVNASGGSTYQILAGGTFKNETSSYAQLRIYHKSGSSLILDTNQLWPRLGFYTYFLSGVDVADVDGDGQNETIFTANAQPLQNQPPTQSQIGIYRWNGNTLIKERLQNFTGPNNLIETRGLAIWSNRGVSQILTMGYYRTPGPTDYAQLGVWSFGGGTFAKVALVNWTTTGSTGAGAQGYYVAAGDVDGDGVPEIVTASYRNNGTLTQSQLRIWLWGGTGTPQLKHYREWVTSGAQGSIVSTVDIRDLDGDGQNEIIAGGAMLTFPFWKAELTVWSDYGSALTLLAETNWSSSSESSADLIRVATGDVNGDGKMDIVTAGYTDTPVGATDVFYGSIRTWTLTGSVLTLQKSYMYMVAESLLNAVTVGDVDKVGKQDIIVAGQQVGKGFVEVRDVAFVYGFITLTWSPSSILTGQSVTLLGSLTNATDGTPLASASVLMESSLAGSSYQILATVTTDSQGRFATSFTPSSPGTYTVRGTWSGDDTHMGVSVTASITVSKAPSVIILSSSAFNAKPGDTITVSGYLYPASASTVTITYTSPSGTTPSHTVSSDNTGYFTDTFTVDSAGTWRISASWAGSSTSSSATSNTLDVQAQPEPIQLTLTWLSLALGIGSLGLAGLAMSRKGKETRPSPTVEAKKP